MNNFIAVACGGAVGACLRYSVSLLVTKSALAGFPYATLMVNGVGSFLMGLLYGYSLTASIPASLKAFIGVGLLGALTTFSTFANESLLLMQQGEPIKAGINIILNLFVCLLLVYLGQLLATTVS